MKSYTVMLKPMQAKTAEALSIHLSKDAAIDALNAIADQLPWYARESNEYIEIKDAGTGDIVTWYIQEYDMQPSL